VKASDQYACSAGDRDRLDANQLRRSNVQRPTFTGGGIAGLVDRDGLGASGIDVKRDAAGDAVICHIFSFRHFLFSSVALTMYGAKKGVR
jgi:hypothetical protein